LHLTPHPALHTLFEALAYATGYQVYRLNNAKTGDFLLDDQRWIVIAAAAVGHCSAVAFWACSSKPAHRTSLAILPPSRREDYRRRLARRLARRRTY
jgi:hypothetical protein